MKSILVAGAALSILAILVIQATTTPESVRVDQYYDFDGNLLRQHPARQEGADRDLTAAVVRKYYVASPAENRGIINAQPHMMDLYKETNEFLSRETDAYQRTEKYDRERYQCDIEFTTTLGTDVVEWTMYAAYDSVLIATKYGDLKVCNNLPRAGDYISASLVSNCKYLVNIKLGNNECEDGLYFDSIGTNTAFSNVSCRQALKQYSNTATIPGTNMTQRDFVIATEASNYYSMVQSYLSACNFTEEQMRNASPAPRGNVEGSDIKLGFGKAIQKLYCAFC